MLRIQKDFTRVVANATGAVVAKDKSKYPKKPEVNDAVFDAGLGVVKLWDGKKWITACTKAGLKK